MRLNLIRWHQTGCGATRWPAHLLATWTLLLALLTPWDSATFSPVLAAETEGRAENAVAPSGSLTGRAGYIAFETFGRDDSITHTELMPYLQLDQHTFFSDARLFMNNDGLFGGNVGLGYRYRLPEGNRFLGASLWYDLDDTTGEMFHQLGISLESCGSLWDVRTNVYLPIGDFEKDFDIALQDQHFVGNRIMYTQARSFAEAMTGFDLELSLPLPTEAARKHDLSIAPGTYMFFGNTAPDIYGYKIRARGNVASNVAMQVEMTDDDTFGTTVTLGVEFAFPGGSRLSRPADVSSRIRTDQFVHRNYNVIVSRQVDLTPGMMAVNPETGLPYVVQHVSSAGSSLGTVEDPYHTIADAQAAGGDIIFVHGNSVLTDPIVMQPGEQILGEGVDHAIFYDGFGVDLLPTVNSSAARPTLLGVAGAAVTLASDSQFSGFVLDSPAGHGIVGNSVQNVVVRNVDVLNAGLDGLFLHDARGTNMFYEQTIDGAAGAAVHIDGGDSDTVIDGNLDNAAGRAVLVENTTGGHVDLSELVVNDDGAEGVLLDNVAGDVSFGRLNVRNSSTSGIAVDGGSGNLAFADTAIENAAGAAVDIRNNSGTFTFDQLDVAAQTGGPGVSVVDSTALGTFNSLNVATNGSTGLFVQNAGELAIESGRINAVNGTAIDVENATVDANLTSASSSGATLGIRIVDHQGTFVIVGDTSHGSGGLIQNATTGVLLANAGTVGLRYVDFDGNGTGIDAADTDRLALSFARVTDSVGIGLDVLNTKAVEIDNSIFAGNGSPADNSIRFLADTQGDYGLFLGATTIDDASAAALAIATTGSADGSSLTLQVRESQITTSRLGAAAVQLAWNGPAVASLVDNSFAATGGSNTGIDITTTSTSELVKFAVAQNTFAFGGGNDIAVRFNTLGPATISAGQNTIDFDGADGIGMDFSLAEDAEVYVYENVITDNAAGATGILFRSMVGPSAVTLQSNTIDLLSTTSVIDRGIIFSSVAGTVDLLEPMNNIVNGATTAFYAPNGSLIGNTYVNGQAVP